MGRRKNISEAFVVDTILTPLSTRFRLETSDTPEQWYYVNTDTYSPDREETPLVITPSIRAYDPDTGTSYTPSLGTKNWYVKINGEAETPVTSADATDEFYKNSGGNLVVRKNLGGGSSIQVRCETSYIDPRDLSVFSVGDSLTLTASCDATRYVPDINLLCEKMIPFHVLKYDPADNSTTSLFAINAKAHLGGRDVTSESTFHWYATDDSHTSETLITASESMGGVACPAFPCFVSISQDTATLTLNMMYTERINIICRVVDTSRENTEYPSKAYTTLRWAVPDINGITYSKQGGSVNKQAGSKTFEQIVSAYGNDLPESIKDAHLAYNWKMRKTNVATVTDKGWGKTTVIETSQLINSKTGGKLPSTTVLAEIYLRGAYEAVTQGGTAVTQGGELVYERPI